MMLHRSPPQLRMGHTTKASREVVPWVVEYAYYGLILYGVMPFSQGLSIRLFSGVAYAALAAFCVMRLGMRAIAPIAVPLACGTSFVALQMMVYGEPLMSVKAFIIWMFQLIIVHCLYFRQDFLYRFAGAALVIGLLVLPYLDYGTSDGDIARAGTGQGAGLANPNDLGQWFGFLCVFFIIAGIEGKRSAVRIGYWLIGAGCFYVVGLSVSRGALLAVAISIVMALRHMLKRGFVPIMSLCLLVWILYSTGIFERAIGSYAGRGTVETGRLLVWPLAIKRFLSSPLIGVGLRDIGTYVPGAGLLAPHNSFLLIALASGIIPFTFFVAYWWRAARGALRLSAESSSYAAFSVPLLIYTFLSAQSSSGAFMEMWGIVSLLMTMALGVVGPVHRLRRGRTIQHLGRWRGASYSPARQQPIVHSLKF
jgi:hypothetical protein